MNKSYHEATASIMVLFLGVTVTVGMTVGLTSGSALAQNALSISNESTFGFNPVIVGVAMSNPADSVEGFVLAVSYDTTRLSVTDVSVAGTVTEATGAELVVPEIFETQGGFTLGVVLDFTTPFDGQEIPPGTNQRIATFVATPDIIIFPPNPSESVPLVFADGTFNIPTLDNILVIGGLSVGAGGGLEITGGPGAHEKLGLP